MYTLAELAEEFSSIRNLSFLGVHGVAVFDSGIEGPCLGVTIQTHGNEPAGLSAFKYFREQNLVKQLVNGSVVFILNNIKAAERYFYALDISDPDERTASKFAARFCDVNMNRLPDNTLEIFYDLRYEIVRAQELAPIWKRFDVGLDIHTTKATIDPMIIALGDVKSDLYRGFPVEIIIQNIENIQIGKPASAFYGNSGVTSVLGVEAGLHEDEKSFEMAITFVTTLLENLGMLNRGSSDTASQIYKEYFITDSVFFPNESYELVKRFGSFEPLEAGQLIARGDGPSIYTSAECAVILPPPGTKRVAPLSDEVLFLSKPVKIVRV
jgi:hypothetical protein